ncbi:hypothetical protein CRG98_008554 [Punica granatum]|uniref:Protein kinase domain-containing protein n=1 Tax=Punica granatum TaxID=22663 RepID=A0A2I0KRR8_PUNGR|nr:hypothetical protein CRG98_008554 [Punica granatum]
MAKLSQLRDFTIYTNDKILTRISLEYLTPVTIPSEQSTGGTSLNFEFLPNYQDPQYFPILNAVEVYYLLDLSRTPTALNDAQRRISMESQNHSSQIRISMENQNGKSEPVSQGISGNIMRRYTFAEVESIIKNFDMQKVIGEGAFGKVFHGKSTLENTPQTLGFTSWIL